MHELFDYLNLVSTNETIEEEIMISTSPSLELKYTLEYTLNSTNTEYSQIPTSIFNNEKLLIYADSSIKKNKEEFLEVFKSGFDIDVRIIFNQELNTNDPVISFFNAKSLNIFLSKFLKLNITQLENLKYKININIHNAPSKIKLKDSSLFILNINNQEELDSETKEFITRFKNKKVITALIPDILNIEEFDNGDIFPIKDTIKSILELLSNSPEQKNYYFIGKYELNLTYNKNLSSTNSINIFHQLKETFNYIYSDNRAADQKLTFYKKVICEFYKKDTSIELNDLTDDNFFQEVLKETIYIYDAYEDGEISIFLKEKKEIIKEYLSISKEILQTTNDYRDTLIKNVIAVIAIFMGNYILKIPTSNNIIYGMIIIYLLILILLTSIQDTLQVSNFNQRKKIIIKHFNFVNNESIVLHKESANMLEKELRLLKFLIGFSILVYSVFLIMFLVLMID
ncbi:hypothetical protein ACQKMD_10940 [Viridibacillus sp. NPDC096237]|uniref:hypothetical protein n=1 Tax=Viridibacillus sp. NPDC096237 TaxID=3390721 RepID=UPI003D007CD9